MTAEQGARGGMLEAVRKYLEARPSGDGLSSFVGAPFFVFVGDEGYGAAKNALSGFLLEEVRTSEFCRKDDKPPDIDGLIAYISGDSPAGRRVFVTGLGEYLALRGADEAGQVLARLKDLDVGNGKVVLLLRGLAAQLPALQANPSFDGRRHCAPAPLACDLTLTQVAPAISQAGFSGVNGLKAALAVLEKGRRGNLVVKTALDLSRALFTVRRIETAYEGVRLALPGFAPPASCGDEAQWAELLAALNENDNSLDRVFADHEPPDNPESDFYDRIAGTDFDHWLYFIFLKTKSGGLTNSYLRHVLDRTTHFEGLRRLTLNAVIDIDPADKRFPVFYRERKALVEKFPEAEIAAFVMDNRKDEATSVYRLTDRTRRERQEIIFWISRHGLVPPLDKKLDKLYPALAEYLQHYQFICPTCPELAGLLTDYFEAYKRQKLANKVESDFLAQVGELARTRPFNRLPSRSEILSKQDKSGVFLYWLDALGVEYLAFITARTRALGLALKVYVARAELPTITRCNRDFYDAWPGEKQDVKALDDIKHKAAGDYDFTKNDKPIHLAAELEVIADLLDRAATKLSDKSFQRILIVSDHGASRLAVLHNQDKYENENRGEHSGRCCPLDESAETLPCAVKANGYLVLADYGRFKGGRAANVEVHGGASLEEVVVPIIELSLKDKTVTAALVANEVPADFREGACIELFINAPVRDVAVVLRGKRHAAEQTDANHYLVRLPDIKRAGAYTAEVYAGDDLIGEVSFKARGKSGKINDGFDDLF